MCHALPAYVPPWTPSISRRRTSLAFVKSRLSACASRRVGVLASRPEKASAELAVAEGPSCIFVGPLETASRDMLEALYLQARDAYYSGKPLIVDDMFDKVELKLRCYGSKSVVKYPRCSLRRHSTYADAEEDVSQVFALASVWILLLAFGSLAILVPAIYTLGVVYQETGHSRLVFHSSRSALESLSSINGMLFTGLLLSIGLPIALASVQALQRLWRNDLVALKGSCPNCGEEVFAFVNAEKYGRPFHRTDCHVCDSALEFRTKVEGSTAISFDSIAIVHKIVKRKMKKQFKEIQCIVFFFSAISFEIQRRLGLWTCLSGSAEGNMMNIAGIWLLSSYGEHI